MQYHNAFELSIKFIQKESIHKLISVKWSKNELDYVTE